MANAKAAHHPLWLGHPGEWAIVVKAGRPQRTVEEVSRAVTNQVTEYVAQYTDWSVTDKRVSEVVRQIVKNHYWPGSHGVHVRREDLHDYFFAPLPETTHVLLVGDPIEGFEAYGITGPDDPRIEQHFANDLWWVLPLQPIPQEQTGD